jgi:LEA14-like dessication related protein
MDVTRRARLAMVLAGVALAASGCALFAPPFERPTLSVVGVEIEEAQLMEQRFRVRIRVQNPNDRALPVRGLSFTIELAGEDFGSGASANAFSVPPLGEAEFDTLVTTNLATTLFKVLPRLKDGAQPLDYRLVGKVTTDLAFLRSIPFDQRGSLPLRQRAP